MWRETDVCAVDLHARGGGGPRWMGRRPRLLVVAVVLTVTTASCLQGGDTAADVQEPPRDPCLLLAPHDIEGFLGARVGEPFDPTMRGAPPPFTVVGMQSCAYETLRDAGAGYSIAYLGLTSGFPRIVFDQFVDDTEDLVPVDGLGEEAVWHDNNLVVLTGELVVGFKVFYGEGVRHQRERTLRLVTRALGDLPEPGREGQ